MTSREQFEKWISDGISSDLHRQIMLSRYKNGNYSHIATRHKWDAWQASREAIEVELKQFDHFQICHYGADERYADGYIDAQNNANKAIESAGLKVKK